MWILGKIRFWKCEFWEKGEKGDFDNVIFCEKWDFENVIFFQKCEFCEKGDFDNVTFVKNDIFKMWFLDKLRIFAPVWYK